MGQISSGSYDWRSTVNKAFDEKIDSYWKSYCTECKPYEAWLGEEGDYTRMTLLQPNPPRKKHTGYNLRYRQRTRLCKCCAAGTAACPGTPCRSMPAA